MARIESVTFRVSGDERRILAALARHLQRSQSDTVRLLLREVARELMHEGATSTAEGPQEDSTEVRA